MPLHPTDANLIAVCLLALFGTLFGLMGLLSRGPFGGRRLLLVLALALAGLGGTAALTGQPDGLWLPPLLLACACGLFLALRSPGVARACAVALAVAGRPRLQWAALLIAGPALSLLWARRAEPDVSYWPAAEAGAPVHQLGEITPSHAHDARTDAGRLVALYRSALPEDDGKLRALEGAVLRLCSLTERVIRRAPPGEASNCHGWVFTGGRYWVRGPDVELILKDNGYTPVARPRPGDLIVYHDATRVIHTGLVRTADADGLILIESKWGKGGRFLHAPEDQPYAGEMTYYRTNRPGHLLRGLPPEKFGGAAVAN